MTEKRMLASAQWASLHTVRVSLVRDWKWRRPPPLFWGERKIPLTGWRQLPPPLYAVDSGYYATDQDVVFSVPETAYPQFDWHANGLYVAGPFNRWNPVGQRIWKLELPVAGTPNGPGGRCATRAVPWTLLGRRTGVPFKFVTGRGEWIEVPGAAPNPSDDGQGHRNHWLDPHCTGYHVWAGAAPEPVDAAGTAVIHWIEKEVVDRVTVLPGPFFLRLHSELPLGVRLEEGRTVFRLFAPRARTVTVYLTPTWPAAPEAVERLSLKRIENGVWEGFHGQSLAGWFYYYSVDSSARDAFSQFEPDFAVLDPYALATVGPQGPGLIVAPERWRPVSKRYQPPHWHDLVIVEGHVRDLAALAPNGLNASERLGFAGLRRWVEDSEFPLADLGFNAIELQPVQQFDSTTREEYHWGYMTNSYFAPCSHYSAQPETASGIEEFRALVEAFHRRTMAVILDVVYNHVGEPNHLARIDKYYYFDLAADGGFMNWSGCGNTLRCDTPMARRLIIDSLVHYLEAFDVDGFRFDLAELIGLETLVEIEKALKRVKPSVILIAEPWSFRGHLGLALKQTGFAYWNDGYRDFLGQYLNGAGNVDGLRYFLAGSLGHYTNWPAQSLNYVESHDDRCWMDRITENTGNNGDEPAARDIRRTHLMVAALMCSLGMPMLSAGQEMLRSKKGHNNTYQRGDLNALDYARARRFPNTYQYFKSWIRFRLSPMGRLLRLASPPGPGYFRYFPAASGTSLATLYNAEGAFGRNRLLFAINPHLSAAEIPLPDLDPSTMRQIADHERFTPEGLGQPRFRWQDGRLELPPLSCGLWI